MCTPANLRRLANPSEEHIAALDVLLEETYKAQRLSEEMLLDRRQTVEKLELFLKKLIPDIKLHMFGSTFTGLGLVSSDVNVGIEVKDGHAECLTKTYSAMEESGDYENVKSDFLSKVPCIYFTMKDVNYRLTITDDSDRNTGRLLKLYSECDPRFRKLAVVFRYWAKVCKVDRQDKGTLPSHSFYLLLVYFLQRCQPPVLPLLYKGTKETRLSSGTKNTIPFKTEVVDFEELAQMARFWKSKNKNSHGYLWWNLFKYFALNFDVTKDVVCIRRLVACTKTEKNWYSRKLAIENPFSVKMNVAQSVISFEQCEYIWDCIEKACRYFGQPTNCTILKRKNKGKQKIIFHKVEGTERFDQDKSKEDVNSAGEVKCLQSYNLNARPTVPNHSSVERTPRANPSANSTEVDAVADSTKATHGSDLNEQLLISKEDERKIEYNHTFQFSSLTDGKGPPIYCLFCKQEGHLIESCPDEKLPDLKQLPQFTQSHKEMLNRVLKRIPREFQLAEDELKGREKIRCNFERFLKRDYPGIKVDLFGSSHNGFGFSQSDLDLCVTFESNETGEGLDRVSYIEDITAKLKEHRGLCKVYSITTAKVPIIRFLHKPSQLEGDISMYSLLSVQNTMMLKMYADIDHRVRILGYAIKIWAKTCDIGDASKGSLSSYAYILMLLHYLQQCKPPVIPVLQELYDHSACVKPELMVDGWNAWFFDDIDALPKVWLNYGKNNQSVAELWLGFFRYYTEEFNMKEQVVCCRQTKMLTKFEKMWNGDCIAIEDPFDLNHNLGCGLSRKMQQYIHKVLIRGRTLYGKPRPYLRRMGAERLHDQFFDTRYLTPDGPPPNDRCCTVCNKIGHSPKDCSWRKNRYQRQ